MNVPDLHTDELQGFRSEARGWLAQNFPSSLKDKKSVFFGSVPIYPQGEDFQIWKERMVAKGWGAPTWPRIYGGGGLSIDQARVLEQEMDAINAFNPMAGIGTNMLGPALLKYASDEQKQRHIPPICRGETIWCQGYSEPGAGSDLASLRTRADDKGDHFLVNGQKIWTSYANHARWCFCLVRTDTTHKQQGISFLLIDMTTPGVDARPIRVIYGTSPFCEVFYTDVIVPKENLVGEINEGWKIAKYVLECERRSLSRNRRRLAHGDQRSVEAVARDYVALDNQGRIADPDLRSRVIRHAMQAKAVALTLERVAAETAAGQSVPDINSVLKNAGTILMQDRGELLLEIMGHQGLGWEGEGYSINEITTTRAFLANKCVTIGGGSYEIQNNIIAKRILGLS